MKPIQKGIYLHYKNKKYEVIDVVVHSETYEEFVLYRALDGSKEYAPGTLWIRPREMFEGTLIVDGKEVKRFTSIDASR
jgi:hypothetical protein